VVPEAEVLCLDRLRFLDADVAVPTPQLRNAATSQVLSSWEFCGVVKLRSCGV
jgi:hypothetical protein